MAAVEVLEAAGWRVIVPSQPLCCGLTWVSTGQLATARRVLQRTVSALSPYLQRGVKAWVSSRAAQRYSGPMRAS